ncbi:MAG TPA: hypothetical protein VI197_20880 [Polyangiaceae bacterium]
MTPRLAAAWLALAPALVACGSSKHDFINDDPEVTSGSSGQASAAGNTDGSGGSGEASTASGHDSGAASTMSGAGGTGGSGSVSTSGSGAGAGGTSASTSGGNTTGNGGDGGNGGVGGAPGRECRDDAECGLATNIAACCPECAAAYPTDVIADDPCLLGKGEKDSGKCEKAVCTDVLCPAIACEEPVHATCDAGKCVAEYECPDGTFLDRGSCVPRCTTNDECVIATRAGECCESCPDGYHRQALEQDACLVPAGKPAAACMPDPEECALILCPAVLCAAPGAAVCDDQGVCGMTRGLER